jgi:hypothetical protein
MQVRMFAFLTSPMLRVSNLQKGWKPDRDCCKKDEKRNKDEELPDRSGKPGEALCIALCRTCSE